MFTLLLYLCTSKLPAPPPAPPVIPALSFSAGFSDDSVFQRSGVEGHRVYGFTTTEDAISIVVEDTVATENGYTVAATISPWASDSGCTAAGCIDPKTPLPPPHGAYIWSATLQPVKAAGGSFTITATKGRGVVNGTVALERVTYGDVYFCSGQSNMALETFFTFSADTLKAEVAAGKYGGLRHFMQVYLLILSVISSPTFPILPPGVLYIYIHTRAHTHTHTHTHIYFTEARID